MTLGRTAENKIKIKTDGADGLRAVECACCGGSCPDNIKLTFGGRELLFQFGGGNAPTALFNAGACYGYTGTFTQQVLCNGELLYGYPYEKCIGISLYAQVTVDCATQTVTHFAIQQREVTSALAQCDVCADRQHVGAYFNTIELDGSGVFQFGTAFQHPGISISVPDSVCTESAGPPQESIYSVLFEIA